ncbi:hypothetical protein NQ318_011266 [Aromia moschata]|uniref:Uncharacterized protein n=1 Tax=Aromia moschata TaxID=1265417 RepID=A0AAV8YJU1_9CUCU|nr:hypothetical protein NQ318_011266 [Aromia moschata]
MVYIHTYIPYVIIERAIERQKENQCDRNSFKMDVEKNGNTGEEQTNLVNENIFVISNANGRSEDIKWRDSFKQILAACVADLVVIQAGINMAFSAVLLPQLDESKSDIHISKSEASWIGLTTVSLVYVSEISHPTLRPMLLNLNSVFVTFGILLTCVLGFWCRWRTMAFIYFSIVVASIFSVWFLPESPHWLVVFKDDPRSAAKSLSWLYSNNVVYEQQFQKLLETRDLKAQEGEADEKSMLLKIRKNINLYKEPIVYKPLIILFIIFLFQQLSGAVGRRTLMFISAIGMCITSLIAGLYTYLTLIPKDTYEKFNITKDITNDNVPLYCVLGYVCFSSLGFLVVPWTLIGELLPVKGWSLDAPWDKARKGAWDPHQISGGYY